MNETQDDQLTECEKVADTITEIIDPFCSPENPVKITFQDITSASYLIKTGIEYTSCTVTIDRILNVFTLLLK